MNTKLIAQYKLLKQYKLEFDVATIIYLSSPIKWWGCESDLMHWWASCMFRLMKVKGI